MSFEQFPPKTAPVSGRGLELLADECKEGGAPRLEGLGEGQIIPSPVHTKNTPMVRMIPLWNVGNSRAKKPMGFVVERGCLISMNGWDGIIFKWISNPNPKMSVESAAKRQCIIGLVGKFRGNPPRLFMGKL